RRDRGRIVRRHEKGGLLLVADALKTKGVLRGESAAPRRSRPRRQTREPRPGPATIEEDDTFGESRLQPLAEVGLPNARDATLQEVLEENAIDDDHAVPNRRRRCCRAASASGEGPASVVPFAREERHTSSRRVVDE